MKKDIMVFIEHVLLSLNKIESSFLTITKVKFLNNEDLQDATIRRIEIIGEAIKNVPSSFRERYPAIPWKDIAATRDKVIHHYFGVDQETIWKIVKEDLPKLKKEIKKILEEKEK